MKGALQRSWRFVGLRRRALTLFSAAVLAAVVGLGGGFTAAEAQPADGAGYRDFSFGTRVSNPTAEKPQSKLWFNDGTWWGSLYDPIRGDYYVHRFDRASQSWTATNALIDGRNNTRADTLWDGTHLYVASATHGSASSAEPARVLRYSYDAGAKTYTLDAGFPVTVASGPVEAIVLDKDTTGKLWVTYTQGSRVYVNRSLAGDSSWGAPFVLPVAGSTVAPDDISSIVAFDNKIGVVWSNQVDDALYFAVHEDGAPDDAWQPSEKALQGPRSADDHINLKFNLQADANGRVYAAVKTSLNDSSSSGPDAPLVYLVVVNRDGSFDKYVFGRVREDHTRPIVMLDQENREVYVFASDAVSNSPESSIVYKKTSMDNPSFPEGEGTYFIKNTNTAINNATSTKQNVTSESGILVLASDDPPDGSNLPGFYYHNSLELRTGSDTTAPTVGAVAPQPGATGVGVEANVEATFSEQMDARTLDNATFTLTKQGATTPVAATVTYEASSRRAILNPDAALEPSATYTAAVKGGDAGAKDDAGNSLAEDEVWTFTTAAPPDTGAPETQITSGPTGTTSSRSASFAFSSSEAGSGFQCSLDGAAFAACSSPKAYSDLPEGSHTFRVRATDAAGNSDATPATRTFGVDTAAPTGSIRINGTATRTTTRSVRLALRASDPGSGVALMRIRNAGGDWTGWQPYATSRSWRLTGPAGIKTVYVQYKDRVGNASPVFRDRIRYAPRR